MKISVVIPAHNEEKYIKKCLESLLNQSWRDFEIVVYLNACTDGTEEVARSFQKKVEKGVLPLGRDNQVLTKIRESPPKEWSPESSESSRLRSNNNYLSLRATPMVIGGVGKLPLIKIITENKKGVVFARQAGTQAAQGEIIASADADTQYPKDWLSKIAKAFQGNPSLALPLKKGEDKNPSLPFSSASPFIKGGSKGGFIKRENKNSPPVSSFKKEENLVGVYGPVYLYDGPFYIRAAGKIFYLPFLYLSKIFGHDNPAGMNFAFKKEIFDKIGGYDINLKSAEDVELGHRLKRYGKLKIAPGLKVYSSARRFRRGTFKFFTHHIKNYFRFFIFKKPPRDFEDVR